MTSMDEVEVLSFEYQALEYQNRRELYDPLHLMLRRNGQVSVGGGNWHGQWSHSHNWREISIRFNHRNIDQYATDHIFEMIGDSHAWHGGPVRKREQVVILTRRTKASPERLVFTQGCPSIIWERLCRKITAILSEMRQHRRINQVCYEQLIDELEDGVSDYEAERLRLARSSNAME